MKETTPEEKAKELVDYFHALLLYKANYKTLAKDFAIKVTQEVSNAGPSKAPTEKYKYAPNLYWAMVSTAILEL